MLVDRTQFVNQILTLIKHIILVELWVLTITFVTIVIGCTTRLTTGRYIVLKLSWQILVFVNDFINVIIWWRVNLCIQLIWIIYNRYILTKFSIFNTYFYCLTMILTRHWLLLKWANVSIAKIFITRFLLSINWLFFTEINGRGFSAISLMKTSVFQMISQIRRIGFLNLLNSLFIVF